MIIEIRFYSRLVPQARLIQRLVVARHDGFEFELCNIVLAFLPQVVTLPPQTSFSPCESMSKKSNAMRKRRF